MATSRSHVSVGSGSSSRSRSDPNMVLCYDNEPAPLCTVRYNGPTLGKRFYGCAHWPSNTCAFFRWADEVDDIRIMQHQIQEYITEIAEHEMLNQMLEEKNKKLKEKFEKEREEKEESWMESAALRDGLYSAKVDRRVMVVLVLSWAFCAVVLLNKY